MGARAGESLQHADHRRRSIRSKGGTITLALDKVIAPLPTPKDTKYVKHDSIQSERLTKFWGRPMHLGAHVLLPEGWDTHPEREVSALHLSRPLPRRPHQLARDAARPQPRAGLRGALQLEGLQPHAAGIRVAVLQGMDRPEFSARDRDRDSARESVLRRQLRGELGQHRPLWRRDRLRAAAVSREEVSRPRPGLGALHVRRLDRRLGSDGRAGEISGRIQRRVHRLSGSDRLPRLHHHRHLQGQERVLARRHVEEDAAARAPQLSRPRRLDGVGAEPARGSARHEDAIGRPVGYLGGGVLAGRTGRLPRAHLRQAHRRDRQEGGRGTGARTST